MIGFLKKDTVMKVVVRALVRWCWILVLCVIIGWLVGKELAVLIPPTYQATAIVQVNTSHNSSFQAVQSVTAYAFLITSDNVLGTVLQSYPNLNRQALAKQLLVTPNTTGQSLTIQVNLPTAKNAAKLANDLANVLVSQQNHLIKDQYAKQLQLLTNQINEEQKIIDTLNEKILKTTTSNITLIQQYNTEIDQHRNLQTQYINQKQNLLTEQALYSQPLSVIQTASVPTKPSSLAGMIPWVPLAMLVLVIIGSVAIYYLEQWADRVNSVYALQQKVTQPLLGSLRWIQPGPQDIPLQTFCELKQPYVEDCRVMMADVLFRAEEARARILAVTSLQSGAGTSSVAAQLAALLAQSRRRVLLIDANLHAPSLHLRLGMHNQVGLAHMLEDARMMQVHSTTGSQQSTVNMLDRISLDNYIMATALENLYLLPAGSSLLNPTSLLSIPEVEQLLSCVAQHSDYVVIDCPALNFAEMHMIGSLSDQTFVVVDATRDRIKQIVKVKDELTGSGVKLSGFIVNKLGRWV